MSSVTIIGLGYIGLPTAIMCAEAGLKTYGYDNNKQRIDLIRSGQVVIEESLKNKLQRVLNNGALTVNTAAQEANCYFVAVPTPVLNSKAPDLSFVYQAVEAIIKFLKFSNLVIIESTVPVGTTEKIANFIYLKTGLRAGKEYFLAFSPERVLPGNIAYELVNNNRVIGGFSKECAYKAADFYKKFIQADISVTSLQAAELVKLIENSSRDVALAFAHQTAQLAYKYSLDPYEIIKLANKHPRVNILTPTCGVGGHCIAVDPWFLITDSMQEALLSKAARKFNDQHTVYLYKRIEKTIRSWKKDKKEKCKLLILGLAYKADSDDHRESPALKLAKMLNKNKEIELTVYEPYVNSDIIIIELNKQPLRADIEAAIISANIVVCLVAHEPLKSFISLLKKQKIVLDFCGLLYQEADLSGKGIIPAEIVFDENSIYTLSYTTLDYKNN